MFCFKCDFKCNDYSIHFKPQWWVVGGILVPRMPIFVILPEQCVNFFAKQIYVYDHDYRRYPLSPVFKREIYENKTLFAIAIPNKCKLYLFWLLNFNRMKCCSIINNAQINASNHLCCCCCGTFCFTFTTASK